MSKMSNSGHQYTASGGTGTAHLGTKSDGGITAATGTNQEEQKYLNHQTQSSAVEARVAHSNDWGCLPYTPAG